MKQWCIPGTAVCKLLTWCNPGVLYLWQYVPLVVGCTKFSRTRWFFPDYFQVLGIIFWKSYDENRSVIHYCWSSATYWWPITLHRRFGHSRSCNFTFTVLIFAPKKRSTWAGLDPWFRGGSRTLWSIFLIQQPSKIKFRTDHTPAFKFAKSTAHCSTF